VPGAQDETSDLSERRAYHEAGHAVAALVLGHSIVRITIAAETNRICIAATMTRLIISAWTVSWYCVWPGPPLKKWCMALSSITVIGSITTWRKATRCGSSVSCRLLPSLSRWKLPPIVLCARTLLANANQRYCVEIRPLVVTTIQRLPQRVIASIRPSPGT
jgi:hypothetical protein